MNRKSALLASVLAAAAFGASAQEATLFDDVPQSTKTRAEVKAELAQAQAEGFEISGGEATLFADTGVVGTRDRAEVRAEAAQLLDSSSAYRIAYRNLYIGG